MKARAILATVSVLGLMLVSFGCGGAATNNTTANTTNTANKPANTTTTNTTSTETAKTETSAGDIGVPECDDYIKKYEACLTKVAKQAPQAEPALKDSFQKARDGWKAAAATPQGKATLASACKQAHDAAKASMAAYSCEW